jgi:WD40 repeat protein
LVFFCLSSEKLLRDGKNFDALLKGLEAAKKVTEESVFVTADTQMMVAITLEQAKIGIRERNRLEGSSYGIDSVNFIDEGKYIASSSHDKITIRDLQGRLQSSRKLDNRMASQAKITNTIIDYDPVHQKIISASNRFDPEEEISSTNSSDTSSLVEGKFEGFITLWDLNGTTLKDKKTWKAHNDQIYDIRFSPDGSVIASASADKTIKLWKLDRLNNQPFRILSLNSWVRSISFAPKDKNHLVSGSQDGDINLWQIDSGKPEKTWEANDESLPVNSVSFSPNGQVIASGDDDSRVRLWHSDGRFWKDLGQDQDKVNSVSFSPKGEMVASMGMDGTIKLWNIDTSSSLMTLTGHTDRVNSISFSPDGKMLASASTDNTVKLWSLHRNQEKILGQGDEVSQGFKVNRVNFSPDNHKIITVDAFGSIKLWRRDGSPSKILDEGGGGEIRAVAFSHDSRRVVTGDINGNINLWDTEESISVRPRLIGNHGKPINDVSFDPNEKSIASAGDDNTIKIWDIKSTLPKTVKVPAEGFNVGVNSISFSPNGEFLASGNKNGTIQLWDINSSKLKTFKDHHTDQVMSVGFSSNSQEVVSASGDSTIKLWNLDGSLIKTFKGHTNLVNSAVFSPDGKVLVSGSFDKSIKFWSIDDGVEIKTLHGYQSEITSISFSPDSKLLATADIDGRVILWNLNLSDLTQKSCEWLGGYLRTNPNVTQHERSLCPLIR